MDTGIYHLTIFGYYGRFTPPIPYPQSQNTMNHAIFEGSAIKTDSRGNNEHKTKRVN